MTEPDWVRPHRPLIQAVVALFSPYVEVVAHDVASDRIVAIWNPVSGRVVGDRSLLEPELLQPVEEGMVLGPYGKVDARGGRWTSVSIAVEQGAGLLCVNFDRSVMDTAVNAMTAFAAAVQPQPAALFERDWREDVNGLVDEWCRVQGVARSRLTSGQRMEIIALLDGKGIFQIRHAAAHVATALSVSRGTVYNLLKSVRGGAPPASSGPTPTRRSTT